MKQLTSTLRSKTIVRVLLYWITFIALYMAGGFFFHFFPPGIPFPGFGNCVSGTFAAFFATWLFLKWETSTFTSIGLSWKKGTFLRFFKGCLLGTFIFFVMVLILSINSGAKWQCIPFKADGYTLITYLTIIPLALMEEVAFRGYPLIRLNQVFGIRITLLIVAVAFALYHMAMGWSIYIALTGPFVWSFVFGLATIWSKGIALPAGIHSTVNMLQNMLGLHGNIGLFWKISFPNTHHAATEVRAFWLHIGLWIAGLIAIEYFNRRSKKQSAFR